MAQRIYIGSDQLLVSYLCNLLEEAGIPALMQKSVVDVPQEECGPLAWYSELWIMQDRQLAGAQLLVAKILSGDGVEVPDLAVVHHLAAPLSPTSVAPSKIA